MNERADFEKSILRKPATVSDAWYMLVGTKYSGPYSSERVRELVKEGAIPANSMLWREGADSWVPVLEVEEFRSLGKALPNVQFSNWTSALDFIETQPALPKTPQNVRTKQDEASARFEAELALHDFCSRLNDSDIESRRANRDQAWKHFREEQGLRDQNVRKRKKKLLGGSGPVNLSDLEGYAAQERLKKRIRRSLLNSRMHRISRDLWLALRPGLEHTGRLLRAVAGLAAESVGKIPLVRQVSRHLDPRELLAQHYAKAAMLLVAAGLSVFAVGQLFRPPASLQSLQDLSLADRRDLESAAITSLLRHGSVGALAVSTSDSSAPMIIAATNLPDGTALALQVDGVAETLIDQFKVSIHSQITIKEGWGRSPILRNENGTAFPRGAYIARLVCQTCESTSKVLATKRFVIGESLDTTEYALKLNEYHRHLQNQARDELTELKQLGETLENQLDDTDVRFRKAVQAPALAGSWREFGERWSVLEDQIDALVARWTSDAVDGVFYHAEFYSSLRKLEEGTRRLHHAQTAYLNALNKGEARDRAEEARLLSDASSVRARLQSLRAKIGSTMKLGPDRDGMPGRLTTKN